MRSRVLCIALLALVLAGCGGARTVTMDAPAASVRSETLRLDSASSPAEIPGDVSRQFLALLSERLYADDAFRLGDGLTLRYRLLDFDPGSRLQRWLLRGIGGAGEASLTVELVYLRDEEVVGKALVEGEVGRGLLGGRTDMAVRRAAREAARYTIRTYR